jgi:two-component system phosphate regulon response regulator PhoB
MFHLPPTIMVIEKDVVNRTSISNSLERSGLYVSIATDEQSLFAQLNSVQEHHRPSIFIIGDPENITQVQLVQKIRSIDIYSSAPFLYIITDQQAKEYSEDEILANDHFLIKPHTQSDLVQKVKSILGKTRPALATKILTYRDLKMDLASFKVKRDSREIHLGPTEFKILQCLIQDPTKICSREEIITFVWGSSINIESRTIDVHINRLRSAIKMPTDEIPFIKTVRAAGYCLSLGK